MNNRAWLVVLLVTVFAVSRYPGLLPANFSVAYALVFCSGVYLRGSLGWWLPLVVMLATDLALDAYYSCQGSSVWNLNTLEWMAFQYVAYALILLLGRAFRPNSHFLGLLGGGILGAFLFYFITNTAAWLVNPAYPHNLPGWLTALTKGMDGYPSTLSFFLKTLFSGGLFTALFTAAEKLTAESPADKTAGAREPADESGASPEPEPAAEPKEAGA